MGCLFQINVYSVLEEKDSVIRKNAKSLLEQRMADFLGSDAHRTFHRAPSVERGLLFLYETYDADYLDAVSKEVYEAMQAAKDRIAARVK